MFRYQTAPVITIILCQIDIIVILVLENKMGNFKLVIYLNFYKIKIKYKIYLLFIICFHKKFNFPKMKKNLLVIKL